MPSAACLCSRGVVPRAACLCTRGAARSLTPRRTRSKVALAAVKSRITLLANKKAQSQKLLRKDLAELCAAGKWDSARIRVRTPARGGLALRGVTQPCLPG